MAKKNIHSITLSAVSEAELNKLVESYIARGYKRNGSMNVITDEGGAKTYIQQVVRIS